MGSSVQPSSWGLIVSSEVFQHKFLWTYQLCILCTSDRMATVMMKKWPDNVRGESPLKDDALRFKFQWKKSVAVPPFFWGVKFRMNSSPQTTCWSGFLSTAIYFWQIQGFTLMWMRFRDVDDWGTSLFGFESYFIVLRSDEMFCSLLLVDNFWRSSW